MNVHVGVGLGEVSLLKCQTHLVFVEFFGSVGITNYTSNNNIQVKIFVVGGFRQRWDYVVAGDALQQACQACDIATSHQERF